MDRRPAAGARQPRGLSGDVAVAALATEQHGVVSTAQLVVCGPTAAATAHRVTAGPEFDRSVAERLLLELLRRAGLPEPRLNARAGGFEVDGLWPDLGVVVEFQSFTFHGDRFASRTGHRKSARLQAFGYDVVPVIWEDLTGAPEAVVATVAAVLAIARGRGRSRADA